MQRLHCLAVVSGRGAAQTGQLVRIIGLVWPSDSSVLQGAVLSCQNPGDSLSAGTDAFASVLMCARRRIGGVSPQPWAGAPPTSPSTVTIPTENFYRPCGGITRRAPARVRVAPDAVDAKQALASSEQLHTKKKLTPAAPSPARRRAPRSARRTTSFATACPRRRGQPARGPEQRSRRRRG